MHKDGKLLALMTVPVVAPLVPRPPRFLVVEKRLYTGWWDSLAALLKPRGSRFSSPPSPSVRSLFVAQAYLPGRPLFSSGLLHLSILLVLIRIPFGILVPRGNSEGQREPTRLVYELQKIQLLKSLPSVTPPGSGGKPGQGFRPEDPPARGSTAFHPRLTIVLKPPRPDNNRQTIIQPSSPPELRIAYELRLPNVLVGNPLAIPKPKLEYRLNATAGRLAKRNDQQAPAPPSVSAASPELASAQLPPAIAQPHLPVAPTTVLSLQGAKIGNTAAAAGVAGGDSVPPEVAGGLLVLGVDPAGVAHLLALPPGNRYGTFSISPEGGQPGSPGGVPGGVVGGGTGGAGSGGDGSVGVGSGHSGGGGSGAGAGTNSILSIAGGSDAREGVGTGSGPGGEGTLTDPGSTSLVFPVLSVPHLRRHSLIVSAGPIGGGGLGVYGALHCGKVYTIFLPMPGKNWALQYCLRASPARQRAPGVRDTVVQLDPGLVPPDPEQRFDFQRLPIPEEKADKMIVLRGVIQADGSVGELKIFQGIRPEMDRAALAAFGRWKFKPALHIKEPVAVEILVGIPARSPHTE